MLKEVLAGVEYLHKRNIIHRDLKPSNIMINEDGIIKIIDFGISKITDKVEGAVTIAMMVVYFAMAILGSAGVGETMGVAQVQNTGFLPEGGWNAVFASVGTAIWFFIGFEFACPIAEENKKPYKNIPYGLIFGLITIYLVDVIFIYGAVKYTDLRIMTNSAVPHIDASVAILGRAGGVIMSSLTIAASFTTTNAYLAAMPRMLYGMARENLIPRTFTKIHPKFRVPMSGLFFTVFLILITTVYITVQGGSSDIILQFINVACITWLVSYIIAMIDVLVLRKRYPEFPRLWKAPFEKVVFPIGILGALYAIYTLSYVMIYALIVMALVATYAIIWNKVHNMPINQIIPLEGIAKNVRDRSEYIPVWDEAVEEWLNARNAL